MSAIATIAQVIPRRRVHSSPWGDAWRRYRRNRMALVSAFIAGLTVFLAIFAPLIAPYSFSYADLAATLQGPSAHHLLGTDEIGRDVLSRLIYGARTSMTVGFLVPLIGLLIGMPVGAVAGWFGRRSDFIALRLIEASTAIPPILVGLLLIAIYGSGLFHVTLFLGIVSWVPFARLTRAQFIALREREFVTAARAIGTPPWRIMLLHILPNAAGPIILLFALSIPAAISAEASYSFLGLGVQDPVPSWGKMITEGGQYIQIDPLFSLLPMLCLALTTLSFNFVGDGLRDALDPNALE
ncbi:MAG TPA: ABC transporter permease [Chloroflexota bacterium]|nr:ABC transporter permease [Chloroflexota bacterium]